MHQSLLLPLHGLEKKEGDLIKCGKELVHPSLLLISSLFTLIFFPVSGEEGVEAIEANGQIVVGFPSQSIA